MESNTKYFNQNLINFGIHQIYQFLGMYMDESNKRLKKR